MTDLNPHIEYFVHKQCTPQWELQPSTISFFDLTFVLGGSAAYYSQSGAHLVQAGQAIFLHRGSFRCAQTRGMECVAFSFQLEEALPWESGVLEWGRDELLLHYMAEFERSWFSLDKNRGLFCKGIFLLLLHRLAELTGQRKQNPHVTEIQRYLEAHFREPVTVKEDAGHIDQRSGKNHLSPSSPGKSLAIKSITMAPPIIKPATDGTQDTLAGTLRRPGGGASS